MTSYPLRAPVGAAAQKPPLLADAGFVCLLLLLFVTLHPFATPEKAAPIISAVEPVASDIWRQLSFTGVFLAILGAAVTTRPAALVRAIPVTVMVLLGWCLLSCLWADEPAVVFRRAVLITEMTVAVLLSVDMLGAELAFRRLRQVLLGVLIVNWIAIPLIPAAKHLPGELDPKLIGDWRGLYQQKNTAGAVCALTVLVYLFRPTPAGGLRNWLIIAAASVFLVMTVSKTSLALLPMAAACGFIYRLGWKNGLDRAILCVIALMLAVVTATVLTLGTDTIIHILRDPDAFTGRTEIWAADFAYVRDHFFLGSGFEAIFGTGRQSPLAAYLPMQSWVIDVNDSHNGYIDILVGLGALGFGIALLALVVIPLARFWPLNLDPVRDGYFALFLFILCHNFTEADFLAPDGTLWLAFLMVIGALRQGKGYAARESIGQRAPVLMPVFSALAGGRSRA